MATSPELELVWDGGSLDLLGENDTTYGPVKFDALGEGTEWGNPQSVRRVLWSALADGSAVATDRHDNRTVVVKLRLTAADASSLAGGEAPLHLLATKRRAELRWTPPNEFGAPAAFIIVASDLTHEMDDLGENSCRRYYSLTLTCLPWARSLNPVIIEALPEFVAAPTTLDDCTSTTGWTGSGSLTFAAVGGAVEISGASYDKSQAVLTKTLARSKRYLAIEVENRWGYLTAPMLTANGSTGIVRPPLVGREGNWYFFDYPVASTTQIELTIIASNSDVAVRVLTIAESDTPALTNARGTLRVLDTPGSAPTGGSLAIESRDAADSGTGTTLGTVIVYSGPDCDPRLSPWRTDAATTDPSALSGRATLLTTTPGSFKFLRPAASFVDGSYSMWAHVSRNPDDTATNWTVTVRAVAAASGASMGTLATFTTTTPGETVTGYELIRLGTLDLPGLNVVDASQINLQFEIAASGFFSLSLGEVLLFNRPQGALTVLDTTTTPSVVASATPGLWDASTGATRVWLDAPSLESDQRVLAGRPSRTLALPVSWGSDLWSWDGSHRFTPPSTFLYVGTTGATNPKVTGEFRPAWHTHPAE